MDKFAELGGGRRSVDPSDLATGNAAAGREYFNGEGKCSSCHSATGDLAGIGTRFQGLNLLRRMLYPTGNPGATQGQSDLRAAFGPDRGGAGGRRRRVLGHRSRSRRGRGRRIRRSAVKVKIDDPLSAHFDQLGKYTDADMHNVYAYLETLK